MDRLLTTVWCTVVIFFCARPNAAVNERKDVIMVGNYWGMHFCKWPPPYSLSTINPEFKIYSATKADNATDITISNISEIDPTVRRLHRGAGYFESPGGPVVFLVHGFRDHIYNSEFVAMKDAFLNFSDQNFTVIMVGWPKGAYLNPWFYSQAASNTQTMSEAIAVMATSIWNLNTFSGGNVSSSVYLYCVGHSLGAHICGQAGLKAPGVFDRVTGLDPAGPGFETCPDNPSIRPHSANCVDIIHTDGNYSGHIDPIVTHLGSLMQWGFVGFYPNGGVNQPGCSVFSNDLRGCSHIRALDLYVDSMRSKNKNDGNGVGGGGGISDGGSPCLAKGPCRDRHGLPDRSCDEAGFKQPMGYYSACHPSVPTHRRVGGAFYLSTNSESPYC